jgi:oligo-1,6-glucosidase
MNQLPWWHNAVVYQIYPRSFADANDDGIGDLAGIIGKLDYLQQLGITVIWLSPVFKSPMDDNGYDISDYYDIAPEFGTLAEMEALIAQARQRGIRIIMDLVVNHTSDEHAWFVDARQSRDNPYRDFYIWRPADSAGLPPNAQQSFFGGSAWQFDSQTGEYYYHLFSKKQPDLNWENPAVAAAIYTMMNWWLEKGIGGFRMDVIELLGKEVDHGILSNGARLHPIIQEMRQHTFANYDVLTVGETWSATPEIAKQYSDPANGELSMVFTFEHITMVWHPEHGKWQPVPFDLRQFKAIIRKWQTALADVGWNSLFWNNHDLPRAVSKYGDDGVYRVPAAKMLATALHFLKGTPYIYQGEEIGMTNVQFASISDYRDIETLNVYHERVAAGVSPDAILAGIHANSRDNARTPMQWHNARHAGFSSSTPWIAVNPNYPDINVAAALADKNSIFYHYQKLVHLRQQLPVMVYGRYSELLEAHPQVFAYQRDWQGQRILVFNNFSAERLIVALPPDLHGIQGVCLIDNYAPVTALTEQLVLQPYESFALLHTSV